MIIDMHVHPMFQEIVQSLSATPQGRQLIHNLEQTSKEAVEAVQALPISDDFKARILGENATRLLAL